MSSDDRELADAIRQLRCSIDKFCEVLDRMLKASQEPPAPVPPHRPHQAVKP